MSQTDDVAVLDAEPWHVTLNAWAFGASVCAQVTGTVLAIVALFNLDGLPEALIYLLILDLVIQTIELVWYSGAWLVFRDTARIAVRMPLRYVDWCVSTPAMLATLFHYSIFRKDPCDTSLHDLFASPAYNAGLAVTLVSVELMLLLGFPYELPESETATAIAERLDGLLGGRPRAGLAFGFAALVVAFAPSLVVVAGHGDAHAVAILTITFVLWLCYGWASLFLGSQPLLRSATYSILDVLAKNSFGIALAVLALTWDGC